MCVPLATRLWGVASVDASDPNDSDCEKEGVDVAKMAATSFSSCTLLFPRTPTRGCEEREIEQLFTGCR